MPAIARWPLETTKRWGDGKIAGLSTALLSLGVWAFTGGPALAHHSMAPYEFSPITIEGTVLQFKYTNPHCILRLRARGKNGRPVVWYLEGDAPAAVDRAGFGPRTFRRGDRLKLLVNPLKNGKPGGFWRMERVMMKNGHLFAGYRCVNCD